MGRKGSRRETGDLSFKAHQCARIVLGFLLLMGSSVLFAQAKRAASPAAPDPAIGDKVLRYVRDRFSIPDTVKMSIEPFRPSKLPGFNEATVTVEEGAKKSSQVLYLSKGNRYLVVGTVGTVNSDPKEEIIQMARHVLKIPDTMQLSVGAFRNGSIPNFLETAVTLDDGKRKQAQGAYLSKDRRFLILGNIFVLTSRREVMRGISLENQPSAGPAKAPVTFIEYADLQCGMCARMHEFLEKDLLPKYRDKVRVVFKEFPLVTIHDWSMSAAIASQCAYQINPEAFTAYRSLIFRQQININASNARDMLLNLAAQAGIDSLKLAACLDSKSTLPRIEQDMREGRNLGVNSTPTSCINGRMIVGLPSPETFYQAVEEALRAAK